MYRYDQKLKTQMFSSQCNVGSKSELFADTIKTAYFIKTILTSFTYGFFQLQRRNVFHCSFHGMPLHTYLRYVALLEDVLSIELIRSEIKLNFHCLLRLQYIK